MIGLSGNAQFEYFELIEGVNGDDIYQASTNIEVVPDGYTTWGLYSTIGPNCAEIRAYDEQGNLLDTNALCSINEFVYVSETVSFKFDELSNQYYYCAGLIDSSANENGYLISFDTELDTNYTKRFSLYGTTYFRGFHVFENEIVMLGEYSPPDEGFVGSFMLRTSLTGEILSSTILHPWQDGSNFSNTHIEKLNDRYYLGGLADEGGDRFGTLSITDEEGNLIEEIDYQDDEFEVWSRLGITKLTNDELMVVQTPGYEEYENDLNIDLFWRTVRLAKIDPLTGEEYWSQNYLDNYEIVSGRWMDIEATPDGGVAILGVAYGTPEVFYYNYLLKIDAEGNQEFFQTYWVEEGGFAVNWLRDLEVAHDGGFIMAGSLENYDIDPWSRSWILKVDACGDMEWQDCQPLSSADEVQVQAKLFPNPSAGLVQVESSDFLEAYTLYDINGRIIDQGFLSQTHQASIDFSEYSGVYVLELETTEGALMKKRLVLD
jgi:hypothetical protein